MTSLFLIWAACFLFAMLYALMIWHCRQMCQENAIAESQREPHNPMLAYDSDESSSQQSQEIKVPHINAEHALFLNPSGSAHLGVHKFDDQEIGLPV